MDLYPFKSVGGMMEPIALQDHLVAIHYIKSVYYKRVTFFEGLPPFQAIDLGAIVAATVSARTPITRMDMYDGEFGQFRLFPLDNIQLRVFLPRGSAKGDLKTIQVPIDPAIVTRNPDLSMTELFVWQDNHPAIEGVNANALAVTSGIVIAMGYRYHTDDPGDPISRQEEQAVNLLRSEAEAEAVRLNRTNQFAKLKDDEVLMLAIKKKMVPCTHIWASGMSAAT